MNREALRELFEEFIKQWESDGYTIGGEWGNPTDEEVKAGVAEYRRRFEEAMAMPTTKYQPIDPFREGNIAELQTKLAEAQAAIIETQLQAADLQRIVENMVRNGAAISIDFLTKNQLLNAYRHAHDTLPVKQIDFYTPSCRAAINGIEYKDVNLTVHRESHETPSFDGRPPRKVPNE